MKLLSIIKLFRLLNFYLSKLVLLEQSCILCGVNCQQQICQDCFLSLNRLSGQPRCPRCLLYLPPKEISCSNCKQHQFHFDRILCTYSYEAPLKKVLYKLKYQSKLEYSTLLSQLFWSGLGSTLHQLPDAIIPVPLHSNKQKQRGFNQSLEILHEFCHKNPTVPILASRRIKDTQPQASLNRLERVNNVAGAFALDHDLTDLHVVLVDDVVTTAATVNELAKACKNQGARQIEVWCLMRAG